jgi:tRNA-splicing ligase RtcB (3'-phosphate/5'-hydroxy nucleic acid ligase)
MKTYQTEGVHVNVWATDIEPNAMAQINNIANLPFTFHHIAIMPDCHSGYGMPIGGVLATNNVIVPNAVGVDIGCGMCAVKTSIQDIDKDTIRKIMGGSKENKGGIRTKVPVGFNSHSKKQDESYMPTLPKGKIIEEQYEKALKQIGTLGGGNHFVEIQKDEEGYIWVMIHSGSRNLGLQIANFYNKRAKELNAKYFSSVTDRIDLAFLPLDEAQDYITEMNYAIEFAFANRKLMMDRVLESIQEVVGSINTDSMINIAHNYARLEHHFGKDVWIHRKGATSARKGEIGIIPGSQGTCSYIVEGLGNPDSFESCSHGAGRLMSRTQAQKTLSLEGEIKKLNDQNIVHGIRSVKDLDESSGAYKDIDIVMENQKDLVKIVHKLQPLAVIKG